MVTYELLPCSVPIASRAPTIDKSNGSLLLTFNRGERGAINCFVMSESDFTIDWFLDGWPIRDALFTTEFQVEPTNYFGIPQYKLVDIVDFMFVVG